MKKVNRRRGDESEKGLLCFSQGFEVYQKRNIEFH